MKPKPIIYSGSGGWVWAVANALMDGGRGNRPSSREWLLSVVPSNVGTARNDGHVTAAENGLDRNDYKAGYEIWIDGVLAAFRKAGLVDGPDTDLKWLGEDRAYKIKFGTKGKERTYTIHGPSTRRASRDSAMLGTPDKDWTDTSLGAAGRVLRGDTPALEVNVRTRQHGKEFIKERKLEMHPLALAIPPMTVEEQQGVRTNIEEQGVKVPVVLFPDADDLSSKGNPKLKVLDGRHRVYFASVTGQPIELTTFEGTEEEARDLVASLNLHRRNLTGIQRALAAERLYGEAARQEAEKAHREGSQRGGKARANLSPPSNGKSTRKKAHQRVRIMAGGEAAGFSDADAKAAATVNRAPKTAAKVDSGNIRRTSVAVREAQAEIEGREPAKPEAGTAVSKPKSVNEHIGSALSSLRTAAQAASLPMGKTTPRDMSRRLDEIVSLAESLREKYSE